MKRLNVKLSLWLVGLTLTAVIGGYFLHEFQIDRNADVLRVQAEQAVKAKNYSEAVKQYNQYLKHRDDPQGYSALAELVVNLAKEADANRKDKMRAYNILEEAIRRHPDLDDVRRRLVDYTMEARRYVEAEEHIHYLLGKQEIGTDLELKLAVCYLANGDKEKSLKKLSELVGYDPATGTFAEKPPAGGKEVNAFELLTQLLRGKEGTDDEKFKTGDVVMSQLVAWNPDSARAHLLRANFLLSWSENIQSEHFKAAKTELDRAYELAPEDADVLVSVGVYASNVADYDKAEEMFKLAKQLYPERQEVYLRLAQLKEVQGDFKGAADQLAAGLEKASDTHAILDRLLNTQFQLGDIEGAKVTIRKMRDKGTFVPEVIRFADAKIKFAEGNYLECSRDLEALRTALGRFANGVYALQADLMLARCYTVMGQPDRQLEVYHRILSANPALIAARMGEASALYALARREQATESMNLLKANAQQAPEKASMVLPDLLQLLLNDQLQLPEDERDWTDVDKIVKLWAEDKARSETEKTVMKADLLSWRGQSAEAAKLLTTARRENPKEVRIWLGLANLLTRDKRTDKVPQFLTLAEKELGDIVQLRLERMRYLAQKYSEDRRTTKDAEQLNKETVAELVKLEKDSDKFNEAQQNSLYMQLGSTFAQLRDYPNAMRCWRKVAANDQRSGTIRQLMFELAADNKNDEDVTAIIKEIHDSRFFGPLNPLYKYCSATRTLYRVNEAHTGNQAPLTEAEKAELADAMKLLNEGLATRNEWHVLWRVKGEISHLLGNIDDAVTFYQRSLDCSRAGQALTARRLVQLLHAQGKYTEAKAVVQYVGPIDSTDTMRRIVMDVLSKGDDQQKALEMAAADVKREPDKSVNWVWYAQLLERAGRSEETEEALTKAVEAEPEKAEIWEMLVATQMGHKKKNEATESVAKAVTHFPDNPAVVGRLYERCDNRAEAEKYYMLSIKKTPDDAGPLHQLAEFYINTSQADKAIPYMDEIIKKTAKSSDKLAMAHLDWARRTKAKTLASTYNFGQVMEAIKLIDENAKDGKMSAQDLLAEFMLLAGRPEPSSRAKALQLVEKLKAIRPLTPHEQVAMAQLYNRNGNWTAASDLMTEAISSKKDDPEILIAYAQMLSGHDQNEDASRWLDALDELITKSNVSVADHVKKNSRALRARLLAKKGQKDEAVALLEELLPRPLPQNQLYLLDQVARTMEGFELYDGAEKLLAEYYSQDPRGYIAMAAFLGRRGQTDKAFELLDHSRKYEPAGEVVICGLECLRRFPKEATKERLQLLETWANEGVQKSSKPQQLRLLLAELYELQGRYPEAITIYREVLADKDAKDLQKAIVKNNLAFVLSLKNDKTSGKEAATLAEEAIRVLGPTSDLLDTRGLAHLAEGDTKSALADLQVAVSDAPSQHKYFHLAQAEQKANNLIAAREAWGKAHKMGLEAEKLTPGERTIYAQLADQLK